MPSLREFLPHRLLPGGHAQTLAGFLLPWRPSPYRAVQHRVCLPDGDELVLHDDCPAAWRPGDRTALLMHGLAGCHQSPYMVRTASKLFDRGIRAFRMDLRGCGAGRGLARQPYHAGRSQDVLAAIGYLQGLIDNSPISVVGFSLSGNVLLKLLGEDPHDLPPQLERAMAVNPAIELEFCVRGLNRVQNRLYDRHFVKLLLESLRELRRHFPDAPIPDRLGRPHRLYDFDDRYTAPVAGFANAHDYYSRCSAAQFIPDIRTRTLILTARDDPLVPIDSFERLSLPANVSLHIAQHGGHLGYIARRGHDPDRRWLDWRILEWVTGAESDNEPSS